MRDKAGRFFRVSTAGQDEASQVPDVDAWCDTRGYETSDATTYVVHGGSAFKGNPKFDRAWAQVIADLKSGRINVVVLWKQDRLDRKLQTFQMIAQVVEAGGRVEFVKQPHLNDLSTMGGRIALKVQEEIAYEESRLKSDRIKIKHAALRAADSLIGRSCYGYTNLCEACQAKPVRPGCNGHRKILVHVPAEVAVIRYAAEQYLAGASLDAICYALNQDGKMPRKMRNGKQPTWCPKTLSGVLRNETLVGRRKSDTGVTVLKVDPILSRDIWERVIRRMDERATRKGISQTKNPAMLTSVIRCGRCTKNMYKTGTGYYCRIKGCDTFVTLTVADTFVADLMGQDTHRDVIETLVSGSNHDEAIAEVKRDMAEAVQAEDFARLASLKPELDRLRSLPAEPTRVAQTISDVTVAEMWAGMQDDAERRQYLLDRGASLTVEYSTAGTARRFRFAAPWHELKAA